ncbi:uncharacterized protein LOC128743808 [Sabethes cyaneus]|uniref:uncharacterized protein LOC128743808 n=1 Tax=Sabethes cyaneus TaxID=53552 RepID=UPI00237E19F3|nr:uncharacterized protein LOC128743808 [Sabethes cyaneus]
MSEIEIYNDSIQFVCDLCSLRYSTFEILMTHNRIKHYHSIRFRCGFCNEAFMNEDDLHCHLILTHRVDPYNLDDGQMIEQRRAITDTVLSEDEKRSIMIRCDCPSNDEENDDAEDQIDPLEEYEQLELDYNELFKQRKRSALTAEEILELTDVFKKSSDALCISKLHF